MNDITASPNQTPAAPSQFDSSRSGPSRAVGRPAERVGHPGGGPTGELAAALAALDAAGIGYTVISETDGRRRPAPAAA